MPAEELWFVFQVIVAGFVVMVVAFSVISFICFMAASMLSSQDEERRNGF